MTPSKEVAIPATSVPILTVEYQDGKALHVWYNNPQLDAVIDLLEVFNIYEIKRVINQENRTAVEIVLDAYLSEKDYEGDEMSEVAEPENGEENGGEEESAQPSEEAENGAESEENGEGEESEAAE